MTTKEQQGNGQAETQILYWAGRVLCATDIERNLNGRRVLVLAPQTIVTPLAADHLRQSGIQVRRGKATPEATGCSKAWVYAQEKPDSLVAAAIMALKRDGNELEELETASAPPTSWARVVAEQVAGGRYSGAVAFCTDAMLVACIANKVGGVRAVGVMGPAQARRALKSLAANLIAVELPGRTFFEVWQILRAVCSSSQEFSREVRHILEELEHAHR